MSNSRQNINGDLRLTDYLHILCTRHILDRNKIENEAGDVYSYQDYKRAVYSKRVPSDLSWM